MGCRDSAGQVMTLKTSNLQYDIPIGYSIRGVEPLQTSLASCVLHLAHLCCTWRTCARTMAWRASSVRVGGEGGRIGATTVTPRGRTACLACRDDICLV